MSAKTFALFLTAMTVLSSTAFAYGDNSQTQYGDGSENRTFGRSITGVFTDPTMPKPDPFARYKTKTYDTKASLPHMWDGMEWEPSMWTAGWTSDVALNKMFKAGIFHRNYLDSQIPVLEVGPRFYQLSDLDRRRSIKLLADHTKVFDNGMNIIRLLDWDTRRSVGTYSQQDGLVMR